MSIMDYNDDILIDLFEKRVEQEVPQRVVDGIFSGIATEKIKRSRRREIINQCLLYGSLTLLFISAFVGLVLYFEIDWTFIKEFSDSVSATFSQVNVTGNAFFWIVVIIDIVLLILLYRYLTRIINKEHSPDF